MAGTWLRSRRDGRSDMTRLHALACCLVLLLSGPTMAQETSRDTAPSGTLRLFIARHGETASNAERRVVGQLDEPLSERGFAQARAMRDRLRGLSFDAIYSSPLARAVETAGIIADGRPVRTLRGLMERHQGAFQGLPAAARADFAPRMAVPGDDLDGGETTFALSRRAAAAVDMVRRLHPRGSVLIVGHFLTNQMLLQHLLGLPLSRAMAINQANEELYVVELSPGRPPALWKLIEPANLGDL